MVSSFVIFFQFNQVPKKLSWDEVEFTRLTLSLDNKPYTPYSRLATGHSTLYFYLILASFKTFGMTNFALRFPSALFGVTNVLIFYLISRIAFSKITYFPKNFLRITLIPFLLSLILASSRWYFNFARFSFEATFLMFLELTSIYFLFKFFTVSNVIPNLFRDLLSKNQMLKLVQHDKKHSIIYLILSGIFSGLALLSYYPGRIFFLLPLVFFFFYSSKKLVKKSSIIFLLTVSLVASPLLIYLTSHKDLRIKEQLFLTDRELNFQQKLSYFGNNIAKLTLMFNLEGDLNGRHNYPGKPIFNPVVGAFFLLGFLVTVLHLKNFYNQLFFIYFILSLTPALFTYPMENPNSLRTYTAIVPSIYFVGNGLTYLLQSEQKSKILLFGAIIFLLVLFALSSLYDLRTYFLYQRLVFNKSFELNGTIQRILNLKLWEKTQSL